MIIQGFFRSQIHMHRTLYTRTPYDTLIVDRSCVLTVLEIVHQSFQIKLNILCAQTAH